MLIKSIIFIYVLLSPFLLLNAEEPLEGNTEEGNEKSACFQHLTVEPLGPFITDHDKHHRIVQSLANQISRSYVDLENPALSLSTPAARYRYYLETSQTNKPWEVIASEIIEESMMDITVENRYKREYRRYLAVMSTKYPILERLQYADGLMTRGHWDLGIAIYLWQLKQTMPPQLKASIQTRLNQHK